MIIGRNSAVISLEVRDFGVFLQLFFDSFLFYPQNTHADFRKAAPNHSRVIPILLGIRLYYSGGTSFKYFSLILFHSFLFYLRNAHAECRKAAPLRSRVIPLLVDIRL